MTASIPTDYPRLCAALTVDGAAEAIDFYCRVLGFHPRGDRMTMPDGRIGHAELVLGDAVLMVADEMPEHGLRGPRAWGGSPITLSLYVENVDAVFSDALRSGAATVTPVATQFYGDRAGQFVDPWGHRWNVASRVEQVGPDELARRVRALQP